NSFIVHLDPKAYGDFHRRIAYAGLYIDLYSTFSLIYDFPEESGLDSLKALKNQYAVTTVQIVRYLAFEIEANTGRKAKCQQLFKEVLADDYNRALEGLSAATAKQLAAVLPLVWELNSAKCFDFFITCAASTSKAVREEIVRLLSGYEAGYDTYKTLTEHKKQSARET
ncbi:MAG: hypothetical protein GY765_22975, partial [bacterium]|nr:hypothetical protein [bacterium]